MIGSDVEFRLGDAFNVERKARELGELEKAARVLGKIEDILQGCQEKDVLSYWQRLNYERAHVAKLNGDAENAILFFQKNQEFAERADDPAGALNAWYHIQLMRYLSGAIDPKEAIAHFRKVFADIVAMQGETGVDDAQLGGMKQNLLTRLCDLSFENQLEDFLRWNRMYEEDPLTKTFRANLSGRFGLALLRNEGRTAFVEGDYHRAAALFCSYLDVDRSLVPPVPNVHNLPKIAHFFQTEAEETARDYRDAGRAVLLALGDGGRESAAHIWRRGLQLKDDIGNRRYLVDIKSELEALEKG